jgi:4-aminobutyrate---pyruvate transaminase
VTSFADSAAGQDIASVLHPCPNFKARPQNGPSMIARGEDVRVFDNQGKSHIEALVGLMLARASGRSPSRPELRAA